MMTTRVFRYFVWSFVIAMAVFSGCRGTTPRVEFYQLAADRQGLEDEQIKAMEQTIAVGVGPMLFPPLLDRPQIVTRTGPYTYKVDEFHRWGGTLSQHVLEILTVNLSILLRSNYVAAHPWEQFFAPDYRIFMDVHAFDGFLNGDVRLIATWAITDGEARKPLLVRKSIIREPVRGASYGAYIEAQNRVLSIFSQEIAQAIKKIAY